MPKLLFARPPLDAGEERKIRKLAGAWRAPGDWIVRAQMVVLRQMVVLSWRGLRTSAIAAKPGCHLKTVRERLDRFNARAQPWIWGRPPPQPRTFVYRL